MGIEEVQRDEDYNCLSNHVAIEGSVRCALPEVCDRVSVREILEVWDNSRRGGACTEPGGSRMERPERAVA